MEIRHTHPEYASEEERRERLREMKKHCSALVGERAPRKAKKVG